MRSDFETGLLLRALSFCFSAALDRFGERHLILCCEQRVGADLVKILADWVFASL